MKDCSLSRGSIQSVMNGVVEDPKNDNSTHDAGHVHGLDERSVVAESPHGLYGDVGPQTVSKVLDSRCRVAIVGVQHNVRPELHCQFGLVSVPCGCDDLARTENSCGCDRGQADVTRAEHDDGVSGHEGTPTHPTYGHGQRLD